MCCCWLPISQTAVPRDDVEKNSCTKIPHHFLQIGNLLAVVLRFEAPCSKSLLDFFFLLSLPDGTCSQASPAQKKKILECRFSTIGSMKGKESMLMPTHYKKSETQKAEPERSKAVAREQKSESLQKSINLRIAERDVAGEAVSRRRTSVAKDAEILYRRQKDPASGSGLAHRRGKEPRSQLRSTARDGRREAREVLPAVVASLSLVKEISRGKCCQGLSAYAGRRGGAAAPGITIRIPQRGDADYCKQALEGSRSATGEVTMPAKENPYEVGYDEACAPGMNAVRHTRSDSSSSNSQGSGEVSCDGEGNSTDWHERKSSSNTCNDKGPGDSGSNQDGNVSGSIGLSQSLQCLITDIKLRPEQGSCRSDCEDEEEEECDGKVCDTPMRNSYPSDGHSGQASTSGSRNGNGDQTQSVMDMSGGRTNGGRGQPGLVGLTNEGNTCYLNSCLQCLIHTLPLVSAVLDDFDQRTANHSSTTSIRRASSSSTSSQDRDAASLACQLAYAFRQLARDLWCKPPYSVISPTSFIQCLTALAPQFAGHHQHDAQEVMTTILVGLHDAVNRVKKAFPYRDLSVEDKPEAELAELTWNYYKSCHDSVIQDIFCGQLQSTIECSVCHHKSHCFDPFMDLSLPLPKRETRSYHSRGRVTLQDCLSAFVAPELLDGSNKWFCSICKTTQASTKQLSIYRLPPVLVFHIKRFCKGTYSYTKDDTSVSYPIKGLDLTEILGNGSHIWGDDEAIYDLYGVCNHSGSLGYGHYTAMCKNVDNDCWYNFNDSSVSPIQDAAVQCSSAYILFYQQRKAMMRN